MGTYFRDLSEALVSSAKGMSVTLKHLFSKPVTIHYPDEKMEISKSYLGKHKLDQPGCIGCSQCAKACPVECIRIDVNRHPGKILEFQKFTVNYCTCMFCGLCVETCPTNVLHMTQEYDLSEYDRKNCVVDLLTRKGLNDEDRAAIEKAKKEAAEKKASKAAEGKTKKPKDDKDEGGPEK
ncbi:MAG: NADH-quinone oxidoreductase subunit I [Planctomycetota bacterium]